MPMCKKKSVSKNTNKYIWHKLRTEFNDCLRELSISDPIDELTLEKILTTLGFLPEKHHTK